METWNDVSDPTTEHPVADALDDLIVDGVAGHHHDVGDHGDGDDHDDHDDVTGRLIRPYAMTGGRTTADTDINLEAQVQTSTRLEESGKIYRWEAAKILKLAERPMALIEIAARAEIPIGVARVVVADLVDEGAVVVQRTSTTTSYTSLLEKVLDGIRNI